MKLKFLLIGLFFTIISFAQNTAKVSGIITDKDSKQPVSFVSVSLKGTMINAESDINGNYEIAMKPGKYTIVYAFIGYKTFEKAITVAADETITENVALQENSNSIEGIVIKGSTNKTKETALLKEQQKAVEMKQSIGAQEMERKGISDVEEGLTKVTGITKAESRGLFVRGLENRYNNLLINDLQVPSNSPFKKIIPLDLFPTDIVGVLSVYKTFNPNIPGDFAGATINVETSEPQSSQTKLSLGFGYVTGNNGSDFLISETANNNQGFLGIQKDKRKLTPEYGSISGYTLKPSEYVNGNKNNSWNVDKISAPVNNSIGFSHSEKFKFKNSAFSYLLSLNGENKYQYRNGVERNFNDGLPNFFNNLETTSYSYQTNSSALIALKYKTDRLQVNTNSFYLRTTESLIQDQFGVIGNNYSAPNRLIRTNQFEQSDYFNNQLLVNYKLTSNEKHTVKGGISYVKTIYELPDRKFLTLDKNNNGTYLSRYGGNNLNRQHFSIKGNYYVSGLFEYNYKFGKEINNKSNKLSLGYNSYKSSSSIVYRFFSTKPVVSGYQVNVDLENINNQIISDAENGLINENEESTGDFKNKINQYVNAGYANLFLNFGEKIEINGGMRFEVAERTLKTRELGSAFDDPFKKNSIKKNYVLPSLNAKYIINDASNLRFASSKTITRPVLIEALPVQIVNPDGTVETGNKDLLDTQNLNIDLKYEFFSTKKDMIAIGAYGKRIQDPIERVFKSSATQIITFQNSKIANLFGAEFEFIFNMEHVSDKLENFSVGMNAALMKTKVEIAAENVLENNPTRDLQGASNWVVNADAKYEFKLGNKISNTATIIYGVKGKNIYAVGTNGLDHIYEMPFHKLDFVYSSKLTKNLTAKFSVDNILNPYQKFELGKESKVTILENTLVVEDFKRGVGLGLSLSYTF
jgi:hypothetical protein